jgi:hypothetical protein
VSANTNQTVDISAMINQLMPLVSVILVIFIVIALIKEFKGAF